MKLPDSLMNSLADAEGFDKEAFEKVHESPEQIVSVRFGPKSARAYDMGTKFPFEPRGIRVPWCVRGQYLSYRPSFTFDPLFHAGLYYVQEASSMFLEQVFEQCGIARMPVKVLDLAAAPGGKSTHIQSLISRDGLLVSNEVIRSRANVLQDNIIKWGAENVVVTNNDPKDFARLENYFDVIVLDAPCSGSGLFRKDEEAINEWSLNNVQLCSQRQQRILADVWPALKKDGILIYSTCSYSREEDEDILDWMMEQFSVSSLQLAIQPDWNIVETRSGHGAYGYRFWPYKVKGEGFFIACFKKLEGSEESLPPKKNNLELLDKNETELIKPWLKTWKRKYEERSYHLVKFNGSVHASPLQLVSDIDLLLKKLRVNYFGVRIGELIHGKLIPDHAFALSLIISEEVERVDVDRDTAIRYLQKKDLNIPGLSKGWKLISYDGFPLGWINVLHNRINNYYPKALRILKEI